MIQIVCIGIVTNDTQHAFLLKQPASYYNRGLILCPGKIYQSHHVLTTCKVQERVFSSAVAFLSKACRHSALLPSDGGNTPMLSISVYFQHKYVIHNFMFLKQCHTVFTV